MQKMKSLFPNMDALIVFEAAARLSSFSQAAKELNVTAPAVSQQIKGLEQALKVRLFTRGHRSVELTPSGKEFKNSVSAALQHLSNAASIISDHSNFKKIKIVTDTSIAEFWLMSRLESLKHEFPNLSFQIFISDKKEDLLKSDFHFAILHGLGKWQGLHSKLLFKEEVFPVCSPKYLSRCKNLVDFSKLVDSDLLDLEYENWNWMNWTIWLTEKKLPSVKLNRKITSNNYAFLIDAAKNNLGIALAWRHLHENDLASGSLIAPFPESVISANGYHLAWPFNASKNNLLDNILDWLITEVSCPSKT